MDCEYKFSHRLMNLRKDKDKTIADMAYECGLSASAISNYERGVRIPDGKALIKLSLYFGCSSDYLLGLSDYKNGDINGKAEILNAFTDKMLKTEHGREMLSKLKKFISIDIDYQNALQEFKNDFEELCLDLENK